MAFVLIVAMLAATPAAHAQKRVALVIGNGAYTKVPRLDNPKNDAAAMEAMFRASGFNAVVRVNDLGVAAMRRALRDFSDTAHDADIAVVFYAGTASKSAPGARLNRVGLRVARTLNP
jgi:uncharacterized caspase-like protein